MKHVIVGMGEIGDALSLLLQEEDIQTKDVFDNHISLPVDIMHIAIPYTDNFVKIVKDYKKQYQPKHTIIYSSIPVGTTLKLGDNVAHSPVEGIHPKLKASFKHFTRWIGSTSEETLRVTARFWDKYAEVKTVNNPDFTEFLKLYSTAKYGINIVWADYANDVAKKLGMEYALVKEFDQDYNELYQKLQKPQFKRYILDPPEGKIGGHCIVPNAVLLNDDYPDDMLDMIIEMGDV